MKLSSFNTAEAFNLRHMSVVNLIEKYIDRFNNLEPNDPPLKRVTEDSVHGKMPRKEYWLSEKQVIFLALVSGNSENALNFKEKIASKFCEK